MAELNSAPQPASILGTYLFAASDGSGGLLAVPASVIAAFVSANGGTIWRDGAGVPANGIGKDGDYFLNSATGDYYRRDTGVYVLISNLKGPQGNAGSVWRTGSTNPTNTVGVDGDFYLHTVNGNVYQKTAGNYAQVANLKGPTAISSDLGNQLTVGTDSLIFLTGMATQLALNAEATARSDGDAATLAAAALESAIQNKAPLTESQIADDDLMLLFDTSAATKKSAAISEFAIAVNKKLLADAVPEAVSVDGSEMMPFLVTDKVTGVKTLKRLRLDAFNAAADHGSPRRFKDRNYGPHAVKVIDTMSDTLLNSSSGVNNSTTAGLNLNIPTTSGSVYRTTAARFGGSIDLVDDTEAVFGTKRIKLVSGKRTLGGGASLGDPAQAVDYSVYRRDTLDRTYDLTNMWLRIDIETPNPSDIDELQLYLGDSSLANFYRWNNLIGDQATRPLQFGRKTRISFPLLVVGAGDTRLGAPGYNNSVTGTPNIAAISSIQIRLLGKANGGATQSATVYIDRIALISQNAPAVSLCMDDGYETWYSKAKPILDKYGARTTLYCIRKYHDSSANNPLWTYYNTTLGIVGFPGNGNRLSEAQIAKFIEAGHEIGFHMAGNHSGQDYSPQEVEDEILAFKKWAKDKFDYDVLTAAYPGGENGYFEGPNFVAGHGRQPIEGYTDYAGYSSGVATTSSWLDGKPKKKWGEYSAHNKRSDGTTYTDDSQVTVRDVFSKHFPFSRSIVLNSPESDPATDGALLRSFLYQFGPASVPSSNTFGRLNLKSANPNYGGRNTYQKDTGTISAVTSTTVVTLGASASAVAHDYDNHIIAITGGTGYGQFRTITDYTAAKIATVDKPFIPALDATSVYTVYKSRNQFIVDAVKSSGGVGIASFHDLFYTPKNFGVVAVGGTATITLAQTADAILDAYKNNWIIITEGTGAGQVRKITSYTAARVVTPNTAFSPALDTTSKYEIFIAEHAGTISVGGTTTATLAGTASAQDKKYVGAFFVTTGGTGSGQVRKITGYTTGRVATFDLALTTAIDATTTYEIFYASQEVLVSNETGTPLQFVYTNPFDSNSLGTQAAVKDLEELCKYADRTGVTLIPLRESFTRSL